MLSGLGGILIFLVVILLVAIEAACGYFRKPALGAILPIAWVAFVFWLFTQHALNFSVRDIGSPIIFFLFFLLAYQAGQDRRKKQEQTMAAQQASLSSPDNQPAQGGQSALNVPPSSLDLRTSPAPSPQTDAAEVIEH
ncbi:hypothetical protein KIM372_10200 [Bombiscardovia nodaiensis]|uniref:Uncharacterized protein n=1 Tax=Bombiscardovia nodaiensis TaxID=2932181 RepID=A0ABM8B896_9BIFI|nr:hypothetical protein KIM372_10200 [Bombiscardovia nodaiensis]